MKVLRNAILFGLLSLEIATVISEETNIHSAQDGTSNSIGSPYDGYYNKYNMRKVRESGKLSDDIYFQPNDQKTLQSNEKVMKKRYDDSGGSLGSWGPGRMNMNFGGNGWMNGLRYAGMGMNFGADRWIKKWKPRKLHLDLFGGSGNWKVPKINMGLEDSGGPVSGEHHELDPMVLFHKNLESGGHGANGMSWGSVSTGGHGNGYAIGMTVVGNKKVVK